MGSPVPVGTGRGAQLGILIKSQLRESDTIARIGGDEFAALITNCTVERGEQICTGLMQTVRGTGYASQRMGEASMPAAG